MKKIKILSKFLGILSTFMLTCLPFSAMESEDNNKQPSENINKINIDEESLEKPIENVNNNQSENQLSAEAEYEEYKDIIQCDEERVIYLFNKIQDYKFFNLPDIKDLLLRSFGEEKFTHPEDCMLDISRVAHYLKTDRNRFIDRYGMNIEIQILKNNLEFKKEVIQLVEKNIDLKKYNLPNIRVLLAFHFQNMEKASQEDYREFFRNIICYFGLNRPNFIDKYGEDVEIKFFKHKLLKDINNPETWETVKRKVEENKKKSKKKATNKSLIFNEKNGVYTLIFDKKNGVYTKEVIKNLENQVIGLYNQFINPNSYKQNYNLLPKIEKQLADDSFKKLKKTSLAKYVKKLESLKNYFLTERPKFINAFSICVESFFFLKPYLIYLDNPNIWMKLAKEVINDLEQRIFKIVKNDESLKKYINSKNIEQILKDNFDYEGKETQPRKYIESLIGFSKYYI